MTITISAAEFKATCLKLMDEAQTTHEEIIVTKRGKPVAKLVPLPAGGGSYFGHMKGSVHTADDLIAGVDEAWEAADE